MLDVAKPTSIDEAVHLAKTVSKLSPFVGNLIEYHTCGYLNENPAFSPYGVWKRQDPGFPDTVFEGRIAPQPGLEIKAWMPLATEITGRFKDSQKAFSQDNTHVAVVAWLPAYVIFGKPQIIDVLIVTARSVAKARDDHYHNPPDYLVIEPQDTSSRTQNLQQTNTNGMKFQGTAKQFEAAKRVVESWGPPAQQYSTSATYQQRLRTLTAKFPYRGDTNYAKLDRIQHDEIESFKERVYAMRYHGQTIAEWSRILASEDNSLIQNAVDCHIQIK